MIALVSLNAHGYRRFRCCAYVERIEFGTALVDSTDPCGSIFLPIRAIMKGGDRVGHMDDVLMDGVGWYKVAFYKSWRKKY